MVPYRVSYSVTDERGRTTTVRPFLRRDLTIGQAYDAMVGLWPLLRGVTDGAVVRGSVSLGEVVNPAPDISPRSSRWLLLLVEDTAGNVDASYIPRLLPAVEDELVAAPGVVPGAVQALYDALVSAGFVSSEGLPLAALLGAVVVESEGE